MRRVVSRIALAVGLVLACWNPVSACVGKTLMIGVVARDEDRILSRVLSILVNERTGTSIKIREYPSFRDCFTALGKNEIDIVVTSVGQSMAEVLERKKVDSGAKIMDEAKQVFSQQFNLVWLEPWGVTDDGRYLQDAGGQPVLAPMAPLVRKDTIKEFPALARLINKMSGKLDTSRMAGLVGKTGGKDPEKVAREYLKAEKLI